MPDDVPFPIDQALARSEWLHALARRLVGEGEADDLVQDAWLLLLRRGSAQPESPGAWLRAVIRGRARDLGRSDRRRAARELRSGVGPRPELSPPEAAERLEMHRLLVEAVGRLPSASLSVVVARYFEGRSTAEIARAEGITESSVRARLTRAHAMLRKDLDGKFGRGGARLAGVLALFSLAYPSGASADEIPAGLLPDREHRGPAVQRSALVLGVGAACLLIGLLVWLARGPLEADNSGDERTARRSGNTVSIPEGSIGLSESGNLEAGSDSTSAHGESGDTAPAQGSSTSAEEILPLDDPLPPFSSRSERRYSFLIAYTVPRGWKGGIGAAHLALPDGTVVAEKLFDPPPVERRRESGATIETVWQSIELAVSEHKAELQREFLQQSWHMPDLSLQRDWIVTIDLEQTGPDPATRTGSATIDWSDTHPNRLPFLVEVVTEDLRARPTLRVSDALLRTARIEESNRYCRLAGHREFRLPASPDPTRIPVPAFPKNVRYNNRSSSTHSALVEAGAIPGGDSVIERWRIDERAPPAFERPPHKEREHALLLPLRLAIALPPGTTAQASATVYLHDGTRVGSVSMASHLPIAVPPTSSEAALRWHIVDGYLPLFPGTDRGSASEPWHVVVDVSQKLRHGTGEPYRRSGTTTMVPQLGVPGSSPPLIEVPTVDVSTLPTLTIDMPQAGASWCLKRRGRRGCVLSEMTARNPRIPILPFPETLVVEFSAHQRLKWRVDLLDLIDGETIELGPIASLHLGPLAPPSTPIDNLDLVASPGTDREVRWSVRGVAGGTYRPLPPGPTSFELRLRGQRLASFELELQAGENEVTDVGVPLESLTRVVEVRLRWPEGSEAPEKFYLRFDETLWPQKTFDSEGDLRILVMRGETGKATLECSTSSFVVKYQPVEIDLSPSFVEVSLELGDSFFGDFDPVEEE